MVEALGGFCMWIGMRKVNPLSQHKHRKPCVLETPWSLANLDDCGGTRPKAMGRVGPEHRLVRRAGAKTQNCFGRW